MKPLSSSSSAGMLTGSCSWSYTEPASFILRCRGIYFLVVNVYHFFPLPITAGSCHCTHIYNRLARFQYITFVADKLAGRILNVHHSCAHKTRPGHQRRGWFAGLLIEMFHSARHPSNTRPQLSQRSCIQLQGGGHKDLSNHMLPSPQHGCVTVRSGYEW